MSFAAIANVRNGAMCLIPEDLFQEYERKLLTFGMHIEYGLYLPRYVAGCYQRCSCSELFR